MHTFFSIKVAETRPRTFILPPKFRSASIVINSCVVTVGRYRPAGNTTPGVSLAGSAIVLGADTVIDGVTILTGQAVTQRVTGLEAGIQDTLTFTCQLSDGTPYIEDIIQPCSTYVPP